MYHTEGGPRAAFFYWRGVQNTARASSPFKKILPDLSTTIENLPKVDTAVYRAFAGTYELRPGVSATIFVADGRLMVKSPDGTSFQLLPVSETHYFVDGADVQIAFGKNENGVYDKGTVYQPGGEMPMKKLQ